MDPEHSKTIAFVDNQAETVDKFLPTFRRILHVCFIVDFGADEVSDQRSLVRICARVYTLDEFLQTIVVVEYQYFNLWCHVHEVLWYQVKDEEMIEDLMKG